MSLKDYRIVIEVTPEELKQLKSKGVFVRYIYSEDDYDVYDDRVSRYRYKVKKRGK